MIVLATVAPGAAAEMFPEQRPHSNSEAGETLASREAQGRGCLTPELQLSGERSEQFSPAQRRAATWLHRRASFSRSKNVGQRLELAFQVTPGAQARLDALTSEQRNRRLDTIARGVVDSRRVLSDTVGLDGVPVRVLLADLGRSTDGYTLSATPREPTTLVLGVEVPQSRLYETAAHQYAHAVAGALSGQLPAAWGEALAVWTTLRAMGIQNPSKLAAIDRRIGRLDVGLTNGDLQYATGNAVWLTYLESRWGTSALRSTLEELARAGDIVTGLDRGVERVSALHLEQAFADFQLWTLFTGDRDDSLHLRSANRLSSPEFTSTVAGLPALSIRRDPALASWGAGRILLLDSVLAPEPGGLRVDFEGDFTAQWAADLVLTSGAGAIHRVPLVLDDGRVEVTVPLDGLTEAVLLVRRIGGDDSERKGYSYSVHREKGYPFELVETGVESVDGIGRLVRWETAVEQDVIGYNVLRSRAEGGTSVRVNPVWIPALGGYDRGVGYRFVDRDADPQVDYEYCIQAITSGGLTSHSPMILAPRQR